MQCDEQKGKYNSFQWGDKTEYPPLNKMKNEQSNTITHPQYNYCYNWVRSDGHKLLRWGGGINGRLPTIPLITSSILTDNQHLNISINSKESRIPNKLNYYIKALREVSNLLRVCPNLNRLQQPQNSHIFKLNDKH